MTSPVLTLLRRALAWLRRNPAARADALELAAHVVRGRAVRLDADGRHQAAQRARARADLLEARAAVRPAIGPVRNTVPSPPPPPRR